ncbi:MAG: transglutaminase domain-containing protein [Pirellulaceae bacterium]|nr:transglutaminase domain-containing protein [Pirellulaceae bacterium]
MNNRKLQSCEGSAVERAGIACPWSRLLGLMLAAVFVLVANGSVFAQDDKPRSPLEQGSTGGGPLSPPNPLSPPTTETQGTQGSPLTDSAAASYGVRLGDSQVVRYQIGAKIKTGAGAFTGVVLRLPVPSDWPEQKVSVIEEDLYDRAGDIQYRVLDAGVRQMMISIPQVPAQTEANVLITYEVSVSPILAPAQTVGLKKPKKVTKETKFFVGDSPLINTREKSLKKLVAELAPKEEEPWVALSTVHRWILDHVTETVSKVQSTNDTLENKQGCNEDRAALFVAMARAMEVPARLVMVEGSQHAEFCLEDPDGNLHWYPCSFRGSGEFGSLSNPAVVFQKGDNVKEPEAGKRVRLVREYVNGKGTAAPQVEIVRRVVQ